MAKRVVFLLVALFTLPALRAAELLEVELPKFHAQALSVGDRNAEMRVHVNGDALTAEDATVTLEGVSYRVMRGVAECRGNGGEAPSMQGMPCRAGEDFKVEFDFGGPMYTSVLTRHKGYVAGVIYAPNGLEYEILPAASGEILRKPVSGKLECETIPVLRAESAPQTNAMAGGRRRAVGTPAAVVDLAEFWTSTAEAFAGGSLQMETMIQSAVDILNTDTKQSGIQNLRFNLVYMGKLDFPDVVTTSTGTYLGDLAGNQQVQSIRNSTGADLVGLWKNSGGAFAAAPRSQGGFAPSNGFHVVNRDGGLGRHTYSHEVFHNFGGQHDSANVTALAGEPYPFARDMCTANWYTILSYDTCVPVGKDVPTIPYITNPDLSYNGVRLGDPEKMDNARMVRISMNWVAGYLPGPIVKGN